MKYCTKCGKELKPNEKFCTHCGEKFNNEEQIVIQKVNTPKPDTMPIVHHRAPIPKNKSSKISKLVILLIIDLIVVLGVLYLIGNYYFSRDMLISNFKDSLISADARKLARNLNSSDPNLVVTDVSVQHLIKYINENPSYIDKIVSSLEDQSKNINKKNDTNHSNDDFILTKRGKKFLIFDNYVIDTTPYYIKLNIAFKDSTVKIGESSTVTAASNNYSKKVGPFILGSYDLKAEYSGLYANFKKETEVTLISEDSSNNNSPKQIDVSVNFDEAKFLSIYSEDGNAELYVDGKGTGVLVKDALNFGPVVASTKVYAVKKVDGNEVKSNEVQVGTKSYVTLNFPVEKKISNPVINQTIMSPPSFNMIYASSELKEPSFNHEPKTAMDNDITTAWVEGSSDDGIGQWIMLQSDSMQNVSGIKIINGYANGDIVFYNNNRVARLTIEFSDGTKYVCDLTDGVLYFQNIYLGKTIPTKYIKFTISSVYEGTKYKDTCISEISVY